MGLQPNLEPRKRHWNGTSGMSKSTEQNWIVKDTAGKIFGPLTTSQVFSEIDKGFFLGEEMIASYPGGNWISISRAESFSDRLLDALVSEARQTPQVREPKASRTPPAKTSSVKRVNTESVPPTSGAQSRPSMNSNLGTPGSHRPAQGSQTGSQNPSQDSAGGDENSVRHTESTSATQTQSRAQSQVGTSGGKTKTGIGEGPVIELMDLKSLERKERLKASKLPIMLIGLALTCLFAALFFVGHSGGDDKRIHLLNPRLNQAPIPEAKVREKLKHALTAFQTDTFSGYERAQNDLVEALEGAPQDPESQKKKAELASMLCLVYRELWPFSYQDSKDSKAISTVMQEARKVDPGGLNGAICEIVQLLVGGRVQEAQTLTESRLVEESQTPVLFEIRGDIYNSVQDYDNAAAYFAQAQTLWAGWLKIPLSQGRALVSAKKYPQAMELFNQVLRASPHHPVAKIELGLLETNIFEHDDRALELLRSALDSGERVTRPTASRANLGLASIYDRRGQPKRALEYAKKAYRLDTGNLLAKNLIIKLTGHVDNAPPDSDELMFVAKQHFRTGDYFSAQAEFKAAFEADPKNATAALYAGKCLWQLNQSDEAIDWLKKAIRVDRNLIEAYTEQADDYAQRYDYLSAMRVLQMAQHVNPQSYEVYRGFATVELRRNNFQGAATFAQKALKIYETDVDTLIIMAKAQLGLQNYEEAKRFVGKALELDYNNVAAQSLGGKIEAGLHGVDTGAAYIKELINHYILYKGQQIPQAAIDYRVTLGEIYMQDERYAQAEDAFRQAMSLDPNNKQALMDYGKALQAQNRGPDALEMFLKAAVLDPSDAAPLFQSAQVYLDVGKLPEAIGQFQRVLKVNVRYPRAHVSLGHAYLRQGDPKKAIEEAEEEQHINPDLAESYLLSGDAYYALGQYSNCASQYQNAVAKHAGGSGILIKMARCYRLTGAIDSAQSLLRQAQATESGNAEIYKEQGAIFQMKSQADEAITAYDKYLMLVPNSPDRAEIENQIRKIQSGDMTPDK